jgi:hypothetical protein
MSIDLARQQPIPEAVEKVIIDGDLSKLSSDQRLKFYVSRCEAAGLDPRCRPFQYLSLSGKLVLYATKEAAEQLNGLHGISHTVSGQSYDEKTGLIEVWVQASTKGGRTTVDLGVVHAAGLKALDLANAKMKAVTKAKRRATLSLCGLGDVLDESELDTLSGVRQCTSTGQLESPKNDSGHGRGQYASPEQVQAYLAGSDAYREKRNQAWLDRWTDEHTGEFLGGTNGELVNRWQLDNHLVKWAVDTGRLDPASLPDGGVKNRQIGMYTAVVYHRSTEDRKALSQEARRYFDQQEERATEALQKSRPELFEPHADDEDLDVEPGGSDDAN